jgi:hypothetical protein
MPRRSFSNYGLEAKRLRLVFSTDEWAELEAIGKRAAASLESVIEGAVRDELVTERKLQRMIAGTFDNLQGREHEEADV